MMNKTTRESWTLSDKAPKCYSYELQRELFWELCLDVSVLFDRYGWGKAFVDPLYDGCEYFGDQDRVLFPDAESTHYVLVFPKAGRQAFDVVKEKRIEWGRKEDFSFDTLCSYTKSEEIPLTESSPRDVVACEIDGESYYLKREDCDFFLKQGVSRKL